MGIFNPQPIVDPVHYGRDAILKPPIGSYFRNFSFGRANTGMVLQSNSMRLSLYIPRIGFSIDAMTCFVSAIAVGDIRYAIYGSDQNNFPKDLLASSAGVSTNVAGATLDPINFTFEQNKAYWIGSNNNNGVGTIYGHGTNDDSDAYFVSNNTDYASYNCLRYINIIYADPLPPDLSIHTGFVDRPYSMLMRISG